MSIAESQQDSTYSGDGAGSVSDSLIEQEYYKENLTPGQKKMSTDLVQFLYPDKIMSGMSHADLVHAMKDSKQIRSKGKSAQNGASDEVTSDQIYVYISIYPRFSTTLLDPHVDTVVSRDEDNHVIAAWVDESKFEQISNLPQVRSIRTVAPPVTNIGSVTSEGDVILKSNQVRSLSGGPNGTGIKVGVISDGVDNRQSSINSGDLPASIQVLSNLQGGDEGTAMAEIVYDIAPGSSIAFTDYGSNDIEFAQHIQDLANAGCKVICDDVSYSDEPYFEDGIISQKINAVTAANNVIYVSSACNYQMKHYQGTYYPQSSSNYHDFSRVGSASINPTPNLPNLYLIIGGGYSTRITLQWDDKFGQSGNDYDLILTTLDGTVLDYSVDAQTGEGNPIEMINYYNSGAPFDAQIWVENYKGVADAKTLEVYVYNAFDVYTYNIVPSDSIPGHNGASSVVSVGAISALDPGNDLIEPYSSLGPVTMRYPSSTILNKPDIAGTDRNIITGAGGFPDGSHRFPGTSAAAPHVAGLAALLWSKITTKTASQIKSALTGTAVDLGSPGWDTTYGFGRADALAAYNSLYSFSSPPASITNLHNTTYQQTSITWTWTDPGSADFDRVMVYLDGIFIVNVTKETQSFFVTSLAPDTQHTLATHTVGTSGLVNMTWVNSTARTAPSNPVPPASITNLHNSTYQQTSITWTWTDPGSADFDRVMVYLDGLFMVNITKGTQSYTASSLIPDTQHTLATHTVSSSGLVNMTWVNSTARTAPASPVPPASIANLHNTTYQQTSITWNWTDPGSADFERVMVYLDGVFMVNVTKGTQSYTASSLIPNTQHTLATHTVGSSGLVNMTWVNSTARTAPASPVPPASITNLHNSTYQQGSITWTWTDPGSADFDRVMVYLDGLFQANITRGTQSFTASSLIPDTQHTIATHTGGTSGLVNLTWVNSTARTAPLSPLPPISVTNLHNTTYQPTSITWTWIDPESADLDHVMVYLDGVFETNVTRGVQTYTALSLTPRTLHSMGTHTVGTNGLVNLTWVSSTASTAPMPVPPAGVTDLHNTTYLPTAITWTWTDPGSSDFDHVMVYLDGMFQANITKGVQTYTASALIPATEYTIGTRTVGTTGLVSIIWVNDTARTKTSVLLQPFPGLQSSPTDVDQDDLYEDINGNGRKDFNDVVVFFKYLEWVKDNEPVGCFDLNGNGRIDYNDVVLLFKKV